MLPMLGGSRTQPRLCSWGRGETGVECCPPVQPCRPLETQKDMLEAAKRRKGQQDFWPQGLQSHTCPEGPKEADIVRRVRQVEVEDTGTLDDQEQTLHTVNMPFQKEA